jgi:hypothetical protein
MPHLIWAALGGLAFVAALQRGYRSWHAYQRLDRNCDRYLIQAIWLFVLSLVLVAVSTHLWPDGVPTD